MNLIESRAEELRLKALGEALGKFPDLGKLVDMARMCGSYEGALAHLQAAVRKSPSDPTAIALAVKEALVICGWNAVGE